MKNKTNIILIGMKGSGKSTIGKLLAKKLGYNCIELDLLVENQFEQNQSEKLTTREIYKKYGTEYFRNLEHVSLKTLVKNVRESDPFVLSIGGGTILSENNQLLISSMGIIIYLEVDRSILLQRISGRGIPPFFPYQDNPQKSLDELLAHRIPIYEKIGNIKVSVSRQLPQEIVSLIVKKLENYEN